MTESLRLMIVEDDASLRTILQTHFEGEGFRVLSAEDGEVAIDLYERERPDILLLDIMMPKMDGISVCKHLRANYQPGPGIVMLTARDTEADTVMGFDVGADDYVIKPARPREIVARIRALARRLGQNTEPTSASQSLPSSILRGPLAIDLERRQVTVEGQLVKLTQTEYALLVLLATQEGKVYSRKELLSRIWETEHDGYARNVDCHITRVRRKLEQAGLNPAPIHTSHGTGYSFSLTTPPPLSA